MSDVVRSIFRQKKYGKLYFLSHDGWKSRETNIVAKSNIKELLSDETIGVYNIEIPMLDINDKFFLENIEKVVTIKSRMRGSDDSIVYYVEDEIVETENTKKSLAECEENILNFKQKDSEYARLNEEFNNLNKEFEKYKSEYKYKNKYFNFG